ncbi:hypothetical protein QUF64_03375 [Anaerolineales bacterium HSG6]|nr:hypothetical protein [Anaerolineales bacterium HSG6]MDM8531600.1 hypothetical protein [Anaerolineales bacterium HSG25]
MSKPKDIPKLIAKTIYSLDDAEDFIRNVKLQMMPDWWHKQNDELLDSLDQIKRKRKKAKGTSWLRRLLKVLFFTAGYLFALVALGVVLAYAYWILMS